MSEYSITPESEEPARAPGGIDPVKYERRLLELRGEQSLPLAVVSGFLASIIGAIIWALITYITNFQIGFMAIGVGLLVGYSVRYFGKGMTPVFGVVGAVFSLFGCLLGNILTVVIAASLTDGIPAFTIFSSFLSSPGIVVNILRDTFSFIDLVFYAIAVYEGYRFSVRAVTDEDLAGLQTEPPTPAPARPTTPAATTSNPAQSAPAETGETEKTA